MPTNFKLNIFEMPSLLFFYFFSSIIVSQNIDQLYDTIEARLLHDKGYLDIHAVTFEDPYKELDELKDIPVSSTKKVFNFQKESGYRFVFLNDYFGNEGIIPLYIEEIRGRDTNRVLGFKDLQKLYFNEENRSLYELIINKIQDKSQTGVVENLLKYTRTNTPSSQLRLSSNNNSDFLRFTRANKIHRYPFLTEDEPVTGTVPPLLKNIQAPDQSGSQNEMNESIEIGQTEFQLDAGFSHLTFFHKSWDFFYGNISAEINTNTEVLNLLPWQGSTYSFGIRTLFNLSGKDIRMDSTLREGIIFDVKILARLRSDFRNLTNKYPGISEYSPLLNIGSGIILDVSTTRIENLPFWNLYVAYGPKNSDNPFRFTESGGINRAFFSFLQWETSMSFYWKSSEESSVRFRFDLGAGGYNIVQTDYTFPDKIETTTNKVQPLLVVYLNYLTEKNDFFGTSARFFDGSFRLNFWLQLVKFNNHSFRLVYDYLTVPLFRSPYIWEKDKASGFLQLRYRYGY